jgi:hypothetical protein
MCSLIVKSPTNSAAGFDPERSRPKWADGGAGLLLRLVERRAPTQILKVMSSQLRM